MKMLARKIAVQEFVKKNLIPKATRIVDGKTHTRFYLGDHRYDYAIYWKGDHSLTFRGFCGMVEVDYKRLLEKIEPKSSDFSKVPF
jgi:hypothetical protein